MNSELQQYSYIQFPDFIKKTPITVDYAELSVKEAKAYNKWLIFQNKMADDSLLNLAKWLMAAVYDFETKEVIEPLHLDP